VSVCEKAYGCRTEQQAPVKARSNPSNRRRRRWTGRSRNLDSGDATAVVVGPEGEGIMPFLLVDSAVEVRAAVIGTYGDGMMEIRLVGR